MRNIFVLIIGDGDDGSVQLVATVLPLFRLNSQTECKGIECTHAGHKQLYFASYRFPSHYGSLFGRV